eukprot:jgi/Botrbrau1/20453/Bobra.145_2s0017.1
MCKGAAPLLSLLEFVEDLVGVEGGAGDMLAGFGAESLDNKDEDFMTLEDLSWLLDEKNDLSITCRGEALLGVLGSHLKAPVKEFVGDFVKRQGLGGPHRQALVGAACRCHVIPFPKQAWQQDGFAAGLPFDVALRSALGDPGLLGKENVRRGLLLSLEAVPPQARALAARLLSCALPHVTTAAGVRAMYCLATSAVAIPRGEGNDSMVIQADAVVAFLGNPMLLEGYLSEGLPVRRGPGHQGTQELGPLWNRGLTDFLLGVLQNPWKGSSAPGTAEAGVSVPLWSLTGDNWEQCTAACVPFLRKAVKVFAAELASSLINPSQGTETPPTPAAEACTALALYLPLQGAAELAQALLPNELAQGPLAAELEQDPLPSGNPARVSGQIPVGCNSQTPVGFRSRSSSRPSHPRSRPVSSSRGAASAAPGGLPWREAAALRISTAVIERVYCGTGELYSSYAGLERAGWERIGANILRGLARLLIRTHSADVEEALLTVMQAVPPIEVGSLALPVLDACMEAPTAARGKIGALLVEFLPPCRSEFGNRLALLLEAAGRESPRRRRETLAYLLPSAAAYLGWAVHARDGCEAAREVALLVREALLGFLTSRRKKSSDDLARDAVAMLHGWALKVLGYALLMQPISKERASSVVRRLAPPSDWLATPVSTPPDGAGDVAALPLVAQEAALAAALLLRHCPILQRLPNQAAEQVAAVEDAQELPHLEREAQLWTVHLLEYARGCFATLSHVLVSRHKGECGGQDRQQRQISGKESLEGQLIADVDGWLGDTVARLPDEDRASPRFSQLAKSWAAFGRDILRERGLEPASLRLIRRFGGSSLAGDR